MNQSNKLETNLKELLDEQSEKNFKARQLKDLWSKYSIAAGGLTVILAVVLIFFYLLYVVFPMFLSASMEQREGQYRVEQDPENIALSEVDEYGEMIASVTKDGFVVFTPLGEKIAQQYEEGELQPKQLHEELSQIDAVTTISHELGRKVFLSGNKALVAAIKYKLEYPNGVRKLVPYIDYPFGKELISVHEFGETEAFNRISAFIDDTQIAIAIANDNRVVVSRFDVEESFLDDTISLNLSGQPSLAFTDALESVHFGEDTSTLFVTQKKGAILHYTVSDETLTESSKLEMENPLTASAMLLGKISLLVGTEAGNIHQVFLLRQEDNSYKLVRVRNFKLAEAPISRIVPEHRRKGFLAIDANHYLGVFYTTSQRKLLTQQLPTVDQVAINARANVLLAGAAGQYQLYSIDNEHPEVSWSALWQDVWYESYPEPDKIWQSSASTNDFEPKFSLSPLTFGTLKAALYAMLFSIPLAIAGAIFTAYFMTPEMRKIVKPTIEIMEALPTVILGFLAGLWLAPIVESNLAGVFGLIFFMPFSILAFGLAIAYTPQSLRNRISAGWQAALLVPIVIIVGWMSLGMGELFDAWFFNGNMRDWVSDEENGLGINFDQRNALVVGIAMGFAVIPTIFSITEDAVFSVPKHLVNGSLALGATPWQTVTRVVIPTASPGMFSAVMIGFGRAVGETIIVLMATGNTPIMDMNIFEGMRTLSANIAVEMPESEVGSTHFRVLFLASFVLFIFTFFFNTFAEVIRQRLRTKYGSL